VKLYFVKVALMYNKRTYRNIEILENQTLDDLHESIFDAFDRYDPHLYSFFLTGKSTKRIRVIFDAPEYTHPMNLEDPWGLSLKRRNNAKNAKMGDLGLREKEKLYYLFDFGDEWWHELTLLKIQPVKTVQEYPRIAKRVGESPEQYPDYEDEEAYEDDEDFM
jgi:hypothetical protein